jgi:Phosphoinositide phospholipase C, Ca2+-dependent
MVRRQPRLVLVLTALLLAALVASACRPIRPGGAGGGHGHGPKVTINQIQVLASHNSYHVEPEPALLAALRSALGAAADGFEYTHRPLADELDAGVRQVELDVFVDDPAGGRYAQPKLVPLLGLDPVDPALTDPGLKVLHVQEVDYRSTCPTFVDCLGDIREWSHDHPGHLPITIQIEAKDDVIPDPANLGFIQPLSWTAPDFAALEAEIRSVFDHGDIISPGEVKGRSRSLAAAVRKDRWPTLDEARGQVMFVLDDKGTKRDAYRTRVPDVDDRLIFVDVPPTDPDAAVMVVNDPIGDAARIRELVGQGFMVRTRADADTVEARSGDTSRREAALASGAQYVSTDYVFPDDHFGTGYVVDLPGDGAARCNPVNAPKRCAKADLSG